MNRKPIELTTLAVVLALGGAATLRAETPSTPATPQAAAAADAPYSELPYTPSLDLSAMDLSVDPCSDFFQYSCGSWPKLHPLPPDQPSWSVYGKLYVDNLRYLWGLLDRAAETRPDRSPVERQIGDYFAACMDEPTIEKNGLEPIQPALAAIDALQRKSDIAPLVAVEKLSGDRALFGFGSEQDAKDSSRFIAAVHQGGLGLPDRDYYTRQDGKFPEQRARYVGHVARMLELVGEKPAVAAADARTVLEIETGLAEASLTRVERRDPYKNYHLLPVPELAKLAPGFDWKQFLTVTGLGGVADLNVQHPAFVTALGKLLAARSLEDWKAYLRWHAVHASADQLPKAMRDENFAFYRRYLRGVEQPPPRWKTCVAGVDDDLGEALGQVYVEHAFSPELKAAALDMTERIQKAMEERIQALDWMDEATKKQALEKLHGMADKIGYPDRWRDYSSVAISRDDYFGNVERATAFEVRRRLNRIGKPIDRGEWGMTPPTVNAYYDAQMNDINFPAGVLQPPLYDAKMDDAPNYGDTGGTIGHELTHGFDDEGRQFDAAGNLRDWWTADDDAKFRTRAQCIVDQYSSYTAVDDIKVNGKLTNGEDIADLGGLILAWQAWQEKTADEKLEPRDGLTPAQRFFVGFAQWDCSEMRPEERRLRALTDPHSPARYRINGVVVNMPEFARAFSCPADSPMVKPAEAVCRIW